MLDFQISKYDNRGVFRTLQKHLRHSVFETLLDIYKVLNTFMRMSRNIEDEQNEEITNAKTILRSGP